MAQLLHKHFIWQDYCIKYSILKIKVLKLDNMQVKYISHPPVSSKIKCYIAMYVYYCNWYRDLVSECAIADKFPPEIVW